jgi:hypothetical protein
MASMGKEGGEGERGGKDEERGGEDKVADRDREGPEDAKRPGEGRGPIAVLRFLMLSGLIVEEVGVAGGPLEVGLEHSECKCQLLEVEVESTLECGECE